MRRREFISLLGGAAVADFAPNRNRLTSMKDAARPLGLTLVPVEARGLDALDGAFATMVRERAQAVVVLGGRCCAV
jgi:putative ABC transport system substrate-binding protein